MGIVVMSTFTATHERIARIETHEQFAVCCFHLGQATDGMTLRSALPHHPCCIHDASGEPKRKVPEGQRLHANSVHHLGLGHKKYAEDSSVCAASEAKHSSVTAAASRQTIVRRSANPRQCECCTRMSLWETTVCEGRLERRRTPQQPQTQHATPSYTECPGCRTVQGSVHVHIMNCAPLNRP